MRTSIHDDVALPTLPLADIVEDRNTALCLHDPAKAAAIGGAEFGEPPGQAAIRERAVLRTIVAIDTSGVVAGRRVRAPRRWRGVVLAAIARNRLALAGF